MPNTVSDQLANKILDKVLRGINFTAAPIFMSIHTADPGILGLNEFNGNAGGASGRQQVSTSGWAPAASGVSTNINTITWAALSSGTIRYIGAWDQISAGNFLFGGPLISPASQAIAMGGTFQLVAGRLSVTFL